LLIDVPSATNFLFCSLLCSVISSEQTVHELFPAPDRARGKNCQYRQAHGNQLLHAARLPELKCRCKANLPIRTPCWRLYPTELLNRGELFYCLPVTGAK
jgi:hypothetical protein